MIECVDETNHKRTFKMPSEALEYLAKREREGKSAPSFSINGKPISVRRLKKLAGRRKADESQPRGDGDVGDSESRP